MNFGMRLRGGVLAALMMFGVPAAAALGVALVSSPAAAQTVSSIEVQGNRRVEIETIRSYFKGGAGGRLDQGQIDDGLKALIETGLFQDVKINHVGNRLVVVVVENPVIGRVAFEGNKKVKDEQLTSEVQSKPRGTLSRPMVQSDAQRIAEIYRHAGRYDITVTPEIIEQPNNRVDLIFTITEGAKTGVKSVEFIGNSAYSSYRLKDVIKTHESNLLSFISGGDLYDSDRVEADRDLIRRFYLKHGYADVQVVAALTEYDPSRKGFLVTFKIEEGQPYRVASVTYQSSIATFNGNTLSSFSRVSVGSTYNAEALEKSVEEMQIECSRRGYAFALVRPRGDRDFETHTVSIVYTIDEGPRTYIERINVRGNTRTRDYVIRREFDISEGDAYNRALVDRAERRLKNLDFFKTVKITTEPGSSSDRVILNVDLEEKSTGDFSVSGGYSTVDGPLAEVSISERNFLGRGLYAKASVTYGEYARGVSLSFVEPYLLDYRVALGLDVFYREQLANLLFRTAPDHRILAKTGIPAPRGFEPAASIFDLSAVNLAALARSTIVTIFLPPTRPGCRSTRRRIISPRFWVALIPPVTLRPVFPRAVWVPANLRCRFARNWRMVRKSSRRWAIRWITTRWITTRTRPTVCSSTSSRTSPVSEATLAT